MPLPEPIVSQKHLDKGQWQSTEMLGQNTAIPSRSLKLLPMLGVPVPSLPSLEYNLPFPTGLRPDSSAVRRGESGPGRLSLGGFLEPKAAELAEESDV